jgi:hypothetical protein
VEVVVKQPTSSARRLVVREDTSQAAVLCTLREQQLCACHIQSLQELTAHDTPARYNLSYLFLQQSPEDLTCTAKVLLAEETHFTTIGITRIYRLYVWSDKNPHAIRSHHCQPVATEILRDCLICAHILHVRVCGRHLLHFLRKPLTSLWKMCPTVCVLTCTFTMTLLHNTAVLKCVSSCHPER